MLKKSNAPLLTIIAISLILFFSAFLWKVFHRDNSEIITPYKVKQLVVKKPPEQLKPLTNTQTSTTVDTAKINENTTPEQVVKNIESRMNIALMYKTPEDVANAIDFFENNNNYEKAQQFREYLNTNYPDYKY